jgi:hypothetical protein
VAPYDSHSRSIYGIMDQWSVDQTVPGAHSHAILSMDVANEYLFSASNQTLKIWELGSLKEIFQSKKNLHGGFIKCVRTMPRNELG